MTDAAFQGTFADFKIMLDSYFAAISEYKEALRKKWPPALNLVIPPLRARTRIRREIEALRARLAPTTHADDEALVNEYALTLAHRWRSYGEKRAALLRRLAELRARAEAAEGSRLAHMEIAQKAIDRAEAAELRVQQLEFNEAEMVPAHHAQNARKRADAAERALAECRDKTIDECADLAFLLRHPNYSSESQDWCEGTRMAADAIRALKKEPRDA